MTFNREILGSITFEPTCKGNARAKDSYADADSNLSGIQNEATLKLIQCMKAALSSSITSISHPGKERPLDYRKDFTIESTMERKIAPHKNANCCSPGANSVKNGRLRFIKKAKVARKRYGIRKVNSAVSTVTRRSEDNSYDEPLNKSSGSGSDDDDEDDDDLSEVSFRFTDYSPMCYRHIREFFNVDPKDYCDVLLKSQWHSIPTPGKSAARLFFCGRDWVIKTMTTKESAFLRKILHRYYYHVRDNPNTLLPHFVGHHRLEIGKEAMNIVIMKNVFATTNTIHEKYDIKGSTVGRYASPSEKLTTTYTQKDLDINRPIHVGHARKVLLIEQIKVDCEFLRRSCIMDYSLLVGVHVLPKASYSTGAKTPPQQLINATDVLNIYQGDKVPMSNPLAHLNTDSFFGGTSDLAYERGKLANTISNGLTQVASPTTSMAYLINNDGAIANLRLDQEEGCCFTCDDGGMRSTDVAGLRKEIYYLGIIDILQEYDVGKHFENFFRGMVRGRKKISCVHPNDYAPRFISFVSSIMV